MDLREFYFNNINNNEYHYCFYTFINEINTRYNVFEGEIEENVCGFEVFDCEEAIEKFKALCLPEVSFYDKENKCWFYLLTYYLNKSGYYIKEFPTLLARPPVDPTRFTYNDIRNAIIAKGEDDNGIVRFATRRQWVANFTFKRKSNHIELNDSIEQKFVEISNRNATFDSMSTDEKLSEITNLIENMLKKNESFTTVDYSIECFDFINDEMVKEYRKKLQCFRHASSKSIEERGKYTEAQKRFLIDYGLTIIKVMHSII